MRKPKLLLLEIVVAGFTLAAAVAFAHAASSGEPVALFTAVEQHLLGDAACAACHTAESPAPAPVTN